MFKSRELLAQISIALLLCCCSTNLSVYARGFGGGGFRGSDGFHSSGGGDSDFDRFNRGDMMSDNGNRSYEDNRSYEGDPSYQNNRTYEGNPSYQNNRSYQGDSRASADHAWNSPDSHDQPIATDGGFSKLAANHTNVNNITHLGNNTIAMSRGDLVNNGSMVRNDFNYAGCFDRDWWARHPGCWYGGWPYGYCWGTTDWDVMLPFLGIATGLAIGTAIGTTDSVVDQTSVSSQPVEYDYGNNITYQDNNIYYGSKPVSSAEEYYNQAVALAQSATTRPSSTKAQTWKPFGVFSLVQSGQTNSTSLFQLTVNKYGVVKGNYYNPLTNETKQVIGAVDKKNQRVCWTISGNKNVVYDTGLANLMEAQSPILVHFSKDQTEQFMLVRLQQPPTQPS